MTTYKGAERALTIVLMSRARPRDDDNGLENNNDDSQRLSLTNLNIGNALLLDPLLSPQMRCDAIQ